MKKKLNRKTEKDSHYIATESKIIWQLIDNLIKIFIIIYFGDLKYLSNDKKLAEVQLWEIFAQSGMLLYHLVYTL